MPTPFATQREPAGFRETPAALQTNGGTAAGRVGVAVPLSLVGAWSLATTGCGTHPLPPICLPETVTVSAALGHERNGGWDRESVGVSFTWRLRPPRAVVYPTNPKPSTRCQP